MLNPSRILKGLKNPKRIPPYLLKKCGIGQYNSYEKTDDFVLFNTGSDAFVGAASSRPEFSATLYYDSTSVLDFFSDNEVNLGNCLEIGCGYGRLTPWISERSDQLTGVEFNPNAVKKAVPHYPENDFLSASATHLPFADDTFDSVVSWTVLGHIPPKNISAAISEIQRVLADDGSVVACEETHGSTGEITWSRTQEEYTELFQPMSLQSQKERKIHPESLSPEVKLLLYR